MFPCKSSCDFCKKSEWNFILSQWKMTFQACNSKGRNFLDLLSDNLLPIEPLCSKGGPWLLQFGHSNSLCAWASRTITNHVPIGEYWLRFFPLEIFSYLCSLYSIKSRQHILHEYQRFNKYWNLRRDTLSYFSLFLQFNPSAFMFTESLISCVTNCSSLLILSSFSFFLFPFLFFSCLFLFLFPFHGASIWMYIVTK